MLLGLKQQEFSAEDLGTSDLPHNRLSTVSVMNRIMNRPKAKKAAFEFNLYSFVGILKHQSHLSYFC